MSNALARVARLSAGILAVGMMVGAVRGGTVVQVTLNGEVNGIFGKVNNYQIQLFDDLTPLTVANYLKYVPSTATYNYDYTVFHRDVPGFILQGGGFKIQKDSGGNITALNPIGNYGAIQNEFSLSNTRGTIAMAKVGGDPNSATNQWFLNLADNSSNLDSQNGGFTVFGYVAGEGMTLVDAVAALKTQNFNSRYYPSNITDGPFSDVPYFQNHPELPNDPYQLVTVLNMQIVPTVAWKGGASSGTNDWGLAANWNAASSAPSGAGVNLSLGDKTAVNTVIDLGSADRTVGNIYYTFGTLPSDTLSHSTTIQSSQGKSLILDNSGSPSLVNVLGDHTISAPVILKNNVLFSVNGSLAVSGNISGAGKSVAMNDVGMLILSGTNTYSGQTLITDGQLWATQAASLPGYNKPGMVSVSPNAVLGVQAGGTGQWAASEIDALRANATFESNSVLAFETSGGDFSYGSNIGGSLGLAKAGSNTLTLTGTNTYTGNTAVYSGFLEANKAASLPGYNTSGMVQVNINDKANAILAVRAGAATGEWASSEINALQSNATFNFGTYAAYLGIDTTSGNFNYSGDLGRSLSLLKLGSNTLTLTGTNTYTGVTVVNGGTLQVGTTGSGVTLPNTTSVNLIASGATLDINGNSQTIQSLTGVTDSEVKLGGGTLTTGDDSSTTFDGKITSTSGGSLTKTGTGTFTLTAINTFSGPVNFNGGLIKAAALDYLGKGTALNFNGGGLQFDVLMDNSDPDNPVEIKYDPSGRTMSFLAGGATLDTNGHDITLANSIGNNGAGGLTKLGDGTLTLSVTNTFKGAVNMNGGLINAADPANLGSGAALNFNGGGLQFDGVYDPSDRIMTFQAGGATLDTNGKNITLANSIGNGGAGSLTKLGAGTLTLTGTNTFTGALNINGGRIEAASLKNLGNGNELNFDGGTLVFDGVFDPSDRTMTFSGNGASFNTNWNNITFANSIGNNGAGGLTKLGPGTLTLTGTNTFTGDVTIIGSLIKAAALNNLGNGNALNFNGGGLQFDGVFDPSVRTMDFQAGTITLDTQANNITLANAIGNGGQGGLTKAGSGTLTLAGTNTFKGDVIINGGLINAASLGNLGSGTALNFNGGGLQFSSDTFDPSQRTMTFGAGGATLDTQANDITLANAIGNNGAGGLTKTGDGTLELKGAVSYSGATLINGGELKINNDLTTTLSTISGAGNLTIDGKSTLIVSSISVNSLSIGSVSSEAALQLTADEPLPATESLSQVPEPSTLLLLTMAGLTTLFAAWRKK